MAVIAPAYKSSALVGGLLRQRIEAIIDLGRVLDPAGWDGKANPARWRGHLDQLLPRTPRSEPLASMPYAEVPAFVAELRKLRIDEEGVLNVKACAFEFAILCAVRSNEALGCRRDEIDLPGRVWTIPAKRMKSYREHRVPLSGPAVEIVEAMTQVRVNASVFPGRSRSAPLTPATFGRLLGRMGRRDVTTHGFRSSFRTWAEERTSASWKAMEVSLAHLVGGKVERSYARSDMLEQRRALMSQWASFIDGSDISEVIPFAGRLR
jgi:integrase